MNKTHSEFLEKIDDVYKNILSADIELLKNVTYLTNIISTIGLYNEGERVHPDNNNIHIYGDDVKYMNVITNVGMWQIPQQLSSYLIQLVSLGNIETFLEIGTCRGATITVIAIYLMRFGVKQVDTIDVIDYLNEDLKKSGKSLIYQ